MKRGHEHDVKGHDMKHSEWLLVVERLKQENDRLHHLTNALIECMEKSGEKKYSLKELDRQLDLFDRDNGC